LGFLLIAHPAAAQTTDKVWDTNTLVNVAHNLTSTDLARVRMEAGDGNPRSQALLGLVYEMGAAGVTADPVQALSWFRKAADQGIAWAEIWAGDFYYTGSPGVPKDLYKAIELYKSAAEHGSPSAAFFVGRMYFFGEGVVMNMGEAAGWFRRAMPADPELVGKMVALAEGNCAESFCIALRQILGAMATESAGQYTGEWNEQTHEWDALKEMRDFERCGFTSSDRTDQGDVQNYFCDSEVVTDALEGARRAEQLANDVERALAAGWTRSPESSSQPNVYFFLREGFPRVRVSYNRTLGDAPQRVTLLVGP
jgi:hypothetical protein